MQTLIHLYEGPDFVIRASVFKLADDGTFVEELRTGEVSAPYPFDDWLRQMVEDIHIDAVVVHKGEPPASLEDYEEQIGEYVVARPDALTVQEAVEARYGSWAQDIYEKGMEA